MARAAAAWVVEERAAAIREGLAREPYWADTVATLVGEAARVAVAREAAARVVARAVAMRAVAAIAAASDCAAVAMAGLAVDSPSLGIG